MSNMSKTELIAAVAETTGQARAAVEETVNAVLSVIKEETAAGRKISLIGFGSFAVKERAERPGRNPSTGAAIVIPASRTLAFKASKTAA